MNNKFIFPLLLLVGCGGGNDSPSSGAHTVRIARTPAQQKWDGAEAYCRTLVISGESGWRLPTQPELTAYAKQGGDSTGGAAWSSTPAQPTYHYYVSVSDPTGTATAAADSSFFGVRCAHD